MKIIYLITFSPAYHYVKEEEIERMAIESWKNPAGQTVAVFENDWGVLIGNEVIKIRPGWHWEVWRPDLRADRIYTHTKANGMVLKSFPSRQMPHRYGMKRTMQEYSESLEEALEEICHAGEKFLVVLPVANKLFFERIFLRFGKRIPFLHPHFINNETLLCNTIFTIHPGKLLHRWLVNRRYASLLRQLDFVTLPQKKEAAMLEKKYGWHASFFAAGFNPEDYPRNLEKGDAREKLGIGKDEFVLLCSSRIVPEKQFDRLIAVLGRLKDYSWTCCITGYGPVEYVKEIQQLADSYGLNGRIRFAGYVSEEKLQWYYQAADLFFMTSIKEAGPGSANVAAWYGLPIISTRTGSVAELLEQEKAGYLVGPERYEEWEKALRYAFEMNPVKKLDEKVLVDVKGRKNNIDRLVATIETIDRKFSKITS